MTEWTIRYDADIDQPVLASEHTEMWGFGIVAPYVRQMTGWDIDTVDEILLDVCSPDTGVSAVTFTVS